MGDVSHGRRNAMTRCVRALSAPCNEAKRAGQPNTTDAKSLMPHDLPHLSPMVSGLQYYQAEVLHEIFRCLVIRGSDRFDRALVFIQSRPLESETKKRENL